MVEYTNIVYKMIKQISTYVSEDRKKELKEVCKEIGLNQANFIRQAVVSKIRVEKAMIGKHTESKENDVTGAPMRPEEDNQSRDEAPLQNE